MQYLQDLTREDLEKFLFSGFEQRESPERQEKRARFHAKQIFHWVYQRGVFDWEGMTDLSKALRKWLQENLEIYRLKESLKKRSEDGTFKFLWSLQDKKTIESVLIPAGGEKPRLTLCISSQVGCAMGCKFCLTGVQGLDRHLRTHEIVSQVQEVRQLANITNIVFMGMGEPLHNLENVISACQVLLDGEGFDFSKRKVTVSTSGVVPAMEELGKRTGVSLAVSLNATTDAQRDQIMPINKKWKIQDLLGACQNYPLGSRRITFEYVLLKGINDSLEDAKRLVKLVRGIPSKINLIPYNPHLGSGFERPSDQPIQKFQTFLAERGLTAPIRVSRGRDILAACGQLRSLFGTARGTEKFQDYARPNSA